MENRHLLEEQAVTLDMDLYTLHYILEDLEKYMNLTKNKDLVKRVLFLCYRLDSDIRAIKENIEKVANL